MGRGLRSPSGAGEPPAGFPRRRAFPGVARRLVLWTDQVADEGDEADLPRALEALSGDDRAHVGKARIHILVDQDIVVLGPVADLARCTLHAVGDHLLR